MVMMYMYDKIPFPYDAKKIADRINEMGLWEREVTADDLLKRTGRCWALHKVGNKIMTDGSAFIKTSDETKRSLNM